MPDIIDFERISKSKDLDISQGDLSEGRKTRVIDFEMANLNKKVLRLYENDLSGCDTSERKYIEQNILRPAISKTCITLKENGISLNWDSVSGSAFLYDTLFDNLCNVIIEVLPSTKHYSDQTKEKIKFGFISRRENDKNSFVYDDGYDDIPICSEYELQPTKMILDVPSIIEGMNINNKIASGSRKK